MLTPRPVNEAARLAALHAHGILDTSNEDAFDAIARLAAQICDAPIAAISFVDAERVWFKAVCGWPALVEIPREGAFCAYTILSSEPTVVMDALNDERFRDAPLCSEEAPIRFYAGMPLIDANGLALGAVAIFDRQLRAISPQQIVALADLVSPIMALLRPTTGLDNQHLDRVSQLLELARKTGRIGLWEWNMQTGQLAWDDKMYTIYGMENQTPITYERWTEIIEDEDVAHVEATLTEAIQSQTSTTTMFRIRHPLLGIRLIESSAKIHFDSAGNAISVIGINQDVTPPTNVASEATGRSLLPISAKRVYANRRRSRNRQAALSLLGIVWVFLLFGVAVWLN